MTKAILTLMQLLHPVQKGVTTDLRSGSRCPLQAARAKRARTVLRTWLPSMAVAVACSVEVLVVHVAPREARHLHSA